MRQSSVLGADLRLDLLPLAGGLWREPDLLMESDVFCAGPADRRR
jgi:hypothetical protein